MQTARHIARKGSFVPAHASERIVLDFDQRYRRRIVLAAESGRSILLDLAEATHMRDGDALVLTDGTLVLVVARAEALLEISASDRDTMFRIIWHLGNRHLPLQIAEGGLRIRADRVIANLVCGLGGIAAAISAPFDPESGISPSDTHGHDVEWAFPMLDASLYRLMSWLSPAYPTGAYSHSAGLEWAVEAKLVTDRASLIAWIEDVLASGAGRNDAVVFVHAYRASADGDVARIAEIAELAAALNPSRERRFEATAQGAAFRRIAGAVSPCHALDCLNNTPDGALCLAVAVAVLAEGHGVPLAPALTAYLHAAVSNLVSAAQRLLPLGQTEGQRAIAALESNVASLVAMAEGSGPDPFDALGSAALMADFATLAHETQYSRMFRT